MDRGETDTLFIICENSRKSNKIMHCAEEKNLSGSFEERAAIFHIMQLMHCS